MKPVLYKLCYLLSAAVLLSACSKKLDRFPKNDITPEKAYATAEGYKAVLAKIYGTLALTGNTGAAGSPDINGLDEGSQVAFIRGFFNCQELPTDEAVVSWNDQTIHDFHNLRFTSTDPFLRGMYARPVYNVSLANEYLREATDEKLNERGITGADADDIKNARAEVRFLRAFNYWVMLDLFGKSTFITEEDIPGTGLPREILRPDLYAYIESELLAIDAELAAAKTNEYGRADQAVAWALLARLYINAEVYTGTANWTGAMNYAQKVIDAGYTLSDDYAHLFMADNHKHTNEFIFTINCDGLQTKSYGNTSFFIHAAAGEDFPDYGVVGGGGWGGYRATKGLADLFDDLSGATDKRAMFSTTKFDTSPEQIAISNVGDFTNGLHVKKYVNIRSDNAAVSDPNKEFADIDFPIFRLSEMYLVYAEAALRANTNKANALAYINKIRERAYGNGSSNINQSQLTLQFVLDERGRELYWEGHRRTDLIRYGLLTTGTYLWPWKGGVAGGTAVNIRYNIYPIPSTVLSANRNLTQNLDY